MGAYVYTGSDQRRITRVIPDLIRHRELLMELIWKDLRVRYRYAAVGFLWAVLEPLCMTVILSLVFFILVPSKTGQHGLTPLLVLGGYVPWQFFSNSILTATRSLVDNPHLVKKVAFPREIIPLAAVGGGLVNLVIGIVLLGVIGAFLGLRPGIELLYLPLVLTILIAMAIGLSLLLSSLNVYFHDVSYLASVALMFAFYASPVFYSIDLVRGALEQHGAPRLLYLYLANPMAGLIGAFRQAVGVPIESPAPIPHMLVWPAICAVLLLAVGVVVFRRNAPTLSDNL